jgi:hypothetical protein
LFYSLENCVSQIYMSMCLHIPSFKSILQEMWNKFAPHWHKILMLYLQCHKVWLNSRGKNCNTKMYGHENCVTHIYTSMCLHIPSFKPLKKCGSSSRNKLTMSYLQYNKVWPSSRGQIFAMPGDQPDDFNIPPPLLKLVCGGYNYF